MFKTFVESLTAAYLIPLGVENYNRWRCSRNHHVPEPVKGVDHGMFCDDVFVILIQSIHS